MLVPNHLTKAFQKLVILVYIYIHLQMLEVVYGILKWLKNITKDTFSIICYCLYFLSVN